MPTGDFKYRYNPVAHGAYALAHGVSSYYKKKLNSKVNRKSAIKMKLRAVTRFKGKRRRTFKGAGDAIGDPALVFTHGRRIKESKRFIEKARDAVSNSNTQLVKSQTCSETLINQCTYILPDILNDPKDFVYIATNINGYNAAGESTTKYLLRNSNIQHQIANQSQGVCFLRVYECVPREDIPYMSSVYQSVQSIVFNGDVDAGYSAMDNDPSSTLFGNPVFCSLFKILKVRQLQLQPGENKKFMIFHNSPKVINMERVKESGATDSTLKLLAMRGLTKFFVFQQWGAVSDAGSSDVTNIGLSVTKLDYVTTIKYEYKWSQDYQTNVYSTGAWGTTTNAIVDELGDGIKTIQFG